MRRVFLFLLTNILILVVFSISFSIISSFMGGYGVNEIGINYTSLLVFCAIFGMGGAFISLLLSKVIAKTAMRVQIINPQTGNSAQRELYQMLEDIAKDADIQTPELGIFPSAQPNAFATGWNRNKALVAISQGMLANFSKNEIRAVVAHEVGHVANGDMVTLTLIQGVVNVFVMFFARIAAFFVDRVIFRREGGGIGIGYFFTVIIFDIIFGILASVVVFAFSRWREYRADRFAALATSTDDMIAALRRLQQAYDKPSEITESLVAFGIKGNGKRRLGALFATHPPLEKRIAALEANRHIS